MGIKIVTWNINGLRSFGGQKQWLKMLNEDFHDVDILCFQETKISKTNLQEWMCILPDQTSYFSFATEANHLTKSSGYSGVATYCRESTNARPWAAEVSFINNTSEIFETGSFDELVENRKFWSKWSSYLQRPPSEDSDLSVWYLVDREGRCVITKHRIEVLNAEQEESKSQLERWLYVFNLYCPRNDQSRPERELYQLKFYHLVQKSAEDLLRYPNNNIIIMGDMNTAHQSIDVYCDEDFNYEQANSRRWIDSFIGVAHNNNNNSKNGGGRTIIDAFRILHPDERNEFTCWNTQIGARETNYGSRIDYILIDDGLLPHLKKCFHLTDYKGSDHCPVMAVFDDQIRFISSSSIDRYSSHCSKLWPQFNPKHKNNNSIRKFFITLNRNGNKQMEDVTIDNIQQKEMEKNENEAKEEEQGKEKQDFQMRTLDQVQNKEEEKRSSPSKSSLKKKIKSLSSSSSSTTLASKSQMKISSFLNVMKMDNEKQQLENEQEDHQESMVPPPSMIQKVIEQEDTNVSHSSIVSQSMNHNIDASRQWRKLFVGPSQEKIPLCSGHNLPCVKRKVRNTSSINYGREFYQCSKLALKPDGHPETKCKFFQWVSERSKRSRIK